MTDTLPQRRDLLATSLLAPLMAALPLVLATEARAGKIDPAETQVTLPGRIVWSRPSGFPENSLENTMLAGSLTQPGLYFTMVRWHPGYMSGPHTYVTDRLCVVVSGTWWVNSGADFDPANCIAAPAGAFVRRVAHTPHYDGVVANGTEPAVIAICGMAPVDVRWLEPEKPGWRRV